MMISLLLTTAMTPVLDNPQELGEVQWGRDLTQAFARSKQSGRPVFLQFQEVPGCATCRSYGDGPLSHPLLVEALENEFIPVVIYNNREGEDSQVLKRFSEPSWNNPVLRIVDHDGKDILPRRDRLYTTEAVSKRMLEALATAERDTPGYLQLAQLEAATRTPARVLFAMHCYWQGEAKLGSAEGVVRTRCGWYDGQEVVEVYYNSEIVSLEALVQRAVQLDCARAVYVSEDAQLDDARVNSRLKVERVDGAIRGAKDSDQRYFLNRSVLRYLPMSEAQSVRVNSALGAHKGVEEFLSPLQLELVGELQTLEQSRPKELAELEAHPRLNALEESARKLLPTPTAR